MDGIFVCCRTLLSKLGSKTFFFSSVCILELRVLRICQSHMEDFLSRTRKRRRRECGLGLCGSSACRAGNTVHQQQLVFISINIYKWPCLLGNRRVYMTLLCGYIDRRVEHTKLRHALCRRRCWRYITHEDSDERCKSRLQLFFFELGGVRSQYIVFNVVVARLWCCVFLVEAATVKYSNTTY